VLGASSCLALGFYAHSRLYGTALDLDLGQAAIVARGLTAQHASGLITSVLDAATAANARNVPPLDLKRAQELLESRSNFSANPGVVSHFAQLPSNLPCEDTWSCNVFTFAKHPMARLQGRSSGLYEWSIFDGHSGIRTAQMLSEGLAAYAGLQLYESGCLNRPYVPNDARASRIIQEAFKTVDSLICGKEIQRMVGMGKDSVAHIVANAAGAHSGSCALVSLFDSVQSVLRVANTGDSRAVLARWDDASRRYVAQAMSVDQTGFNPDEVARLKRDHPGEDVVDPKTGRVHGMAVSRAFGDARWKWPSELSQRAHDLFWGPSPRPNSVIKTPPYLTAEPEVMETRIQGGDHPDFLIMASDGLWDHISSEDAVTCVQMWLNTYEPIDHIKQGQKPKRIFEHDVLENRYRPSLGPPSTVLNQSSPSRLAADSYDTYFDHEGVLRWKVSPEHFVVEDDHCGVHLVKNALGGSRRDLFTGILTMTPPLSRNVRDDITVRVIFFGADTRSIPASRMTGT